MRRCELAEVVGAEVTIGRQQATLIQMEKLTPEKKRSHAVAAAAMVGEQLFVSRCIISDEFPIIFDNNLNYLNPRFPTVLAAMQHRLDSHTVWLCGQRLEDQQEEPAQGAGLLYFRKQRYNGASSGVFGVVALRGGHQIFGECNRRAREIAENQSDLDPATTDDQGGSDCRMPLPVQEQVGENVLRVRRGPQRRLRTLVPVGCQVLLAHVRPSVSAICTSMYRSVS